MAEQVSQTDINQRDGSFVNTYSDGLIATETKTIKGTSYIKTYTWTSGNLTGETLWTAV